MGNVKVLDSGMAAWAQRRQVNRGVAKWDIERQVRLVAGSIVSAPIVASIWAPGMRFVAGAIGAASDRAHQHPRHGQGAVDAAVQPWQQLRRQRGIDQLTGRAPTTRAPRPASPTGIARFLPILHWGGTAAADAAGRLTAGPTVVMLVPQAMAYAELADAAGHRPLRGDRRDRRIRSRHQRIARRRAVAITSLLTLSGLWSVVPETDPPRCRRPARRLGRRGACGRAPAARLRRRLPVARSSAGSPAAAITSRCHRPAPCSASTSGAPTAWSARSSFGREVGGADG